ncbi:MYND-type domain-containing protein [Mycena chlorophos]|uniref:MYND-type domain-containing protein n=1 Tax=Mycena chlorophos TaxID=658473 RepID=A0A8H6SW76_MYCCL|nr:MYND-type domain-containing protein [Mycena chlorophos]
MASNDCVVVPPFVEGGLPTPPKDECFVCKKTGVNLQRCSKCRTFPYCSKECQASDWKEHKKICLAYIQQGALDYTATSKGMKGRSKKGRDNLRSRGDVIRDLGATAQRHNGDTFTMACWHAMNLVQDIGKAKTHFLAVTLSRNLNATNPRALHSLVDAAVLPFAVLEEKFSGAALLAQDASSGSHREIPMTPLDMLRANERERVRDDGALGAVLVTCVELGPKEKAKSVEQAVRDTMCPTYHPLGLFGVHQRSISAMPAIVFEERFWKLCLRNALDGYAWALQRHPLPAGYE